MTFTFRTNYMKSFLKINVEVKIFKLVFQDILT